MNRKIFIDAGSNDGESCLWFLKNNPEFECYAFEPNPKFTKYYRNQKNIKLLIAAVWIKEELKKFFLDSSKKQLGSTLFDHKKTGKLNKDNFVTTQCIDFSKWLKQNFDLTDTIILKMDIEGAEYFVLDKMIEDQTINMIKILYIEWHDNKIDFPKFNIDELKIKLLSKISQILPWKDPPK